MLTSARIMWQRWYITPLVSLYIIGQLFLLHPNKLGEGPLTARGQRASLPCLQPLGEHIGYADKEVTQSLKQNTIFIPQDRKAELPSSTVHRHKTHVKDISKTSLRQCLWQLDVIKRKLSVRHAGSSAHSAFCPLEGPIPCEKSE